MTDRRDDRERRPGLNWLVNKIAQALRKLAKAGPPWHRPVEPEPEPDPIILPEVSGNLYYILHDYDLPDKYGYYGHSRTWGEGWKGNPITPETCRIQGVKSTTKLSAKAQAAVESLNPISYSYVTGSHVGWVNKGEWPMVETLTFSGNLVDVVRIEGNRAYIRTWKGELDDPCTKHHWTNIKNDDTVFEGGWKGPAWIILAYPDGAWIPLDKLRKV
jgi:hypothetical protein